MRRTLLDRPVPSLSALSLAVLLLLTAATSASAYSTYYQWKTAVSGSADDATKWNPAGVPNFGSFVDFVPAGTYTVTFPASLTTTSLQGFSAGNVTAVYSAPHTTGNVYVGATATCNFGVLNTQWLQVGSSGFPGTLTLTRQTPTGSSATWNSQAASHSGTPGDAIGKDAAGTLNVFGGAHYWTGNTAGGGSWDLNIAPTAGFAGTVSVAGNNPFTISNSGLHTVSTCDIIVGQYGTGLLSVANRGFVDASDGVYIGYFPGSVGTVNVGPNTTGSSSMTVRGPLGVGATIFNTASGNATMNLTGSAFVNVLGRVDVGNPGGDQGATLRMLQGANFRASGGVRVSPTSGGALDLRGGIFHVVGGAFQWPASRQLVVSSLVGTPELWIGSGVANTGPSFPGTAPQLVVGRGGSGKLRVVRPGTSFTCGVGPTVLGDSLGGNGLVVVDSSAIYTTTGYTNIGDGGFGEFDASNGAQVNLGAVYLGNNTSDATVGGTMVVKHGGTLLTVHDVFSIGGYGGSLGFGNVLADSGGTVYVITSGIVNPPTMDIRGGTGTLFLANGGHLSTAGAIGNSGDMVFQNGELEANGISLGTSGRIRGYGFISSAIQGTGRLEPYAAADSFGVLRISDNLTLQSPARYVVNLGTTGGLHCDTLEVGGAAVLAGTLEIRTAPGFSPAVWDSFTVLKCTSRTGTFTSVTWNGAPLSGQAIIIYRSNAVRIVIPGGVGVEPQPGAAPTALRFAAIGTASSPALLLDLPMTAMVDVTLYDITGRAAAQLNKGELSAGRYRFDLSGNSTRLSSGAYFARAVIRANGTQVQRTVRTILLR